MRLAGVIAIAVALGATAFAARAVEGDLEGAKDHPMVQRFPGSVIGTSVTREFEEFPFPTGDEGSDNTTKTVEGRYTRLDYNLPSNASCTQVIRNYEKAFQAAGLTTHRGVNLSDKIFTNPPGGKWVSAEGKPAGRSDQVYLYYACTGEGGDLGRLIVVESQEMEQKVALDASAMQAEIEKSGWNISRAVSDFPGALRQTTTTLGKVQTYANVLAPTAERLRPAVRALNTANHAIIPFARETTPILRRQIRPFVRDARPLVRDLRPAAQNLATATPDLTKSFGVLNHLFNMLGYNQAGHSPPGANPGYLYTLAWLAHQGANLFASNDANGSFRPVFLAGTCGTLAANGGQLDPALLTALNLLGNVVGPNTICG